VPATVEVTFTGRLAAPIEATAYFVASESLANATRHAQPTVVRIRAAHAAGADLVVEITDDGVGGADPARGTGLTGLSDRVAALGGTLTVDSPPGRGTRVVAVLPCE
jgi:signal transduction histidine kinase